MKQNKIQRFTEELLKVTQEAAIACFDHIGAGHEKHADAAAVRSMRDNLNAINFNATVVIGEGERDQAPMLFIGEKLGAGIIEVDIAVDPLEGTKLCAYNKPDSLTVLAVAEKDKLLHAPDVYMEKIAIPPLVSPKAISLKNTPTVNIHNILDDLDIMPQDLMITVLERARHEALINEIRKTGARIRLISDGDVAAAINTSFSADDYINVYMGIGGAPEGVLAAAALKTLGGYMEGRLLFNDDEEKERGNKLHIRDFNKIYKLEDMVQGHVAFFATGVTDGSLVGGVKYELDRIETSSLVLTSWDNGVAVVNKSRDF